MAPKALQLPNLMAIFKDEPNTLQRLDWALLQNGAITLYWRPDFLADDSGGLKDLSYQVNEFDCSSWRSELEMHLDFASRLEFPSYYGHNLDAFNDCIRGIGIPEESGRVLIFRRFDRFTAQHTPAAWAILDIIEDQSRHHLLFGRRLLALVQTDDPRLDFEKVGGRGVNWNRREWLDSNRGL